jgi:hypothetical protein
MATYVFHGDRGGVGKSLLACSFGEYLLSKGRSPIVVETDTQNGDVGRYFTDVVPVRYMDLRVSDGWIELLSVLQEEKAEDLIVALPAGIGAALKEHSGDLLAAVADLKRSLTVWWAMNRTPDSVALLQPVAEAFGGKPNVKIVAVRNLFFGSAEKFARWNTSKIRKSFLSAGGLELDFPELHERLIDVTFGGLPARRFSANGETGLRYGETLVLKRWVEHTQSAFEAISEQVGVGKR